MELGSLLRHAVTVPSPGSSLLPGGSALCAWINTCRTASSGLCILPKQTPKWDGESSPGCPTSTSTRAAACSRDQLRGANPFHQHSWSSGQMFLGCARLQGRTLGAVHLVLPGGLCEEASSAGWQRGARRACGHHGYRPPSPAAQPAESRRTPGQRRDRGSWGQPRGTMAVPSVLSSGSHALKRLWSTPEHLVLFQPGAPCTSTSEVKSQQQTGSRRHTQSSHR